MLVRLSALVGGSYGCSRWVLGLSQVGIGWVVLKGFQVVLRAMECLQRLSSGVKVASLTLEQQDVSSR